MFQRVQDIQIPTPYPVVDSVIERIEYYMTPLDPMCHRSGYPAGDIVQVATRITYWNGEQYANILPISFSALKQLIVNVEKEAVSHGTPTIGMIDASEA